ncbi:MAG TPA: ribosome assembly RNA-binding protein YhbY [Pseudogracilibacillus sp.]|nr:ribosome assembly RNA-binding protein YhbY [Pseudogracilibacillus sp.]
MLTGKQKRYLRKEAHHLKPVFQVGKQGVNDNLIHQIHDYLEKNELMKVSILQNCSEDKKTVAEQLEQAAEATVVQIIGNNIVLYKPSAENKTIELPN